jgi:hypothetical protein
MQAKTESMAKKTTQFQKGVSGNPKGKAKGTLNKRTIAMNLILETAMSELSKELVDDIATVNSSRRLQMVTDLMNYITPKLSHNKNDDSVEHSGEININVTYSDDFTSPNDTPIEDEV